MKFPKIPWDKSGNAAQLAVAMVALITLYLTAQQSRKTAEFLAQARDAFVAQAFPVVKFDSYEWLLSPEGLSCVIPAIGISVRYRNFSGVPVAVEDSQLLMKIGNAPVGPAEVEEITPGEVILPPGRLLAITFQGPPIVEAYKRVQGGIAASYPNFELQVTFRSLVSGKRYLYTGKVTIREDCHLPTMRQYSTGPETITDLPPR